MIQPLYSNTFESNTYVVLSDTRAIIDPGALSETLPERIGRYIMSADALINTHCHFDHVGANEKALEIKKMSCYAHEEDAKAITEGDDTMQLASLFGRPPVKHEVENKLKDGDVIDLGDVKLKVIHTPGHTPGGICLYEENEKILFTGDTIFADSIGRYDFTGSSYEDLKASVKKLADLAQGDGVDIYYPGHGPSGTSEDIIRIYDYYF